MPGITTAFGGDVLNATDAAFVEAVGANDKTDAKPKLVSALTLIR